MRNLGKKVTRLYLAVLWDHVRCAVVVKYFQVVESRMILSD